MTSTDQATRSVDVMLSYNVFEITPGMWRTSKLIDAHFEIDIFFYNEATWASFGSLIIATTTFTELFPTSWAAISGLMPSHDSLGSSQCRYSIGYLLKIIWLPVLWYCFVGTWISVWFDLISLHDNWVCW